MPKVYTQAFTTLERTVTNPEKRAALPSKILSMTNVARYQTVTPVWAAPMKLGDYAKIRKVDVPDNEDPNSDGYIVEQVGTVSNTPGFGGSIIWMVSEYFESKFETSDVPISVSRNNRMLTELTTLNINLQKLEVFLKSELFSTLSDIEQKDLVEQSKAMKDYSWFLSRRVSRLGANNVNA